MKLQILVASLSVVLLANSAKAEVVERVLVKVNGDIVTLSEFEARQLAAVQAGHIAPAQMEVFLREHNARILQEAVDELLLVQRAAELEVKVRPDYVKEVIDGIKKENHIESDQALQDQLRQEGLSMEDLKRNIERSILRRQVLSKEVESKVSVTEADARADYKAHQDRYRHPATVHLQEIVLGADDEALARLLVARARGGEDFGALAKAHSKSRSRESGGDLGTLASGEMNPDLEKVAFSLSPGGVSDPILTADGLRILHVLAKTPEKVVPFEDAQADIIKTLSQERMDSAYQAYLERLRKNAVLEYRVKEVPVQLMGPTPPGAPVLSSPLTDPLGPNAPEITTSTKAAPERIAPSSLAGDKPPEPPKKKDEEPKDPSKPPQA